MLGLAILPVADQRVHEAPVQAGAPLTRLSQDLLVSILAKILEGPTPICATAFYRFTLLCKRCAGSERDRLYAHSRLAERIQTLMMHSYTYYHLPVLGVLEDHERMLFRTVNAVMSLVKATLLRSSGQGIARIDLSDLPDHELTRCCAFSILEEAQKFQDPRRLARLDLGRMSLPFRGMVRNAIVRLASKQPLEVKLDRMHFYLTPQNCAFFADGERFNLLLNFVDAPVVYETSSALLNNLWVDRCTPSLEGAFKTSLTGLRLKNTTSLQALQCLPWESQLKSLEVNLSSEATDEELDRIVRLTQLTSLTFSCTGEEGLYTFHRIATRLKKLRMPQESTSCIHLSDFIRLKRLTIGSDFTLFHALKFFQSSGVLKTLRSLELHKLPVDENVIDSEHEKEGVFPSLRKFTLSGWSQEDYPHVVRFIKKCPNLHVFRWINSTPIRAGGIKRKNDLCVDWQNLTLASLLKDIEGDERRSAKMRGGEKLVE